MPTKRWRGLIGAALAAALISGAVYFARTQGASAPTMRNMEDAKPAEPAPKGSPARLDAGEIKIPPEVQQRIGVTLGKVTETPLNMAIRSVGVVRPNETKIAHIHLKTEGWVEKLFVAFTGQKVKAGDPLLSIYSPAFFAAQREFLAALRAAKSNSMADQLMVLETARRRLELWDVPPEAIKALEMTGKPSKSLTLRTPISGTVLEKKAFPGQRVTAENDLYVVADLSSVWVQAKIFAYELPHVQVGMPVKVTLPSLSTRPFAGKVVFIDPTVEEMTRTVQVRVELPNPDGQIKPGMFGNVSITHAMGTGLTVPTSAVIRTGEQDIVFRAVSEDRFVPVNVKISPLRFEDRFQILEGLKAGDEVVVSANFLVDSESQLQAGGGMAGMPGMGAGGGKGSPEKPPGMEGMPGHGGPTGKPDHSKMQR